MNLQINGYTLNSNISSIKDLIEVTSKRGIIADTKSQAKSILHLLRLVGFKHLSHFTNSEVLELNVPCKAEAKRIYYVEYKRGLPVVMVENFTVVPPFAVKVKDIIAKKSMITWIQDM